MLVTGKPASHLPPGDNCSVPQYSVVLVLVGDVGTGKVYACKYGTVNLGISGPDSDAAGIEN